MMLIFCFSLLFLFSFSALFFFLMKLILISFHSTFSCPAIQNSGVGRLGAAVETGLAAVFDLLGTALRERTVSDIYNK